MTGSRAVKILLGFLVFLVIADGIITNILISRGIASEFNPFLLEYAGNNGLIAIKIVGALVSALILYDIYGQWPKLGIISIYTFTILYTVIVLWNVSLCFSSPGF